MDLLSPSQRPVAVFSTVVQALVGQVLDRRQQLAKGSAVGSQLVGDEPPWLPPALGLQTAEEETACLLLVAAHGDHLVEDVPVSINGAPQPVQACL